MPDFCLCTDIKCPMRQDCRRFTTQGDGYGQAYFLESPRKDDECEFFLDTRARLTKKNNLNKKEKI